jgi:hypothetical protein
MGGACSTYGESRVVYKVMVGRPEKRDSLEDPGVDGRIILKWIFRKWDVGSWNEVMLFRTGTGGGLS